MGSNALDQLIHLIPEGAKGRKLTIRETFKGSTTPLPGEPPRKIRVLRANGSVQLDPPLVSHELLRELNAIKVGETCTVPRSERGSALIARTFLKLDDQRIP